MSRYWDYNFNISKSTKNGKKLMIVINRIVFPYSTKIIHIGSSDYEDYTIHEDDQRKDSYIKRHYKNEDWEDPFTAGFWARWLLWNKKTLNDSIRDIRKRFKLSITTY